MSQGSGDDAVTQEVQRFLDFVGKSTRGGRPGVSLITVSVRDLEPATDMQAARAALVQRLNDTATDLGARMFNLNDRFLVLVPPQDELNFVNYVYQVRMRVIDTIGGQASELGFNPSEFTDVLQTKRDASRLARLAQAAVSETGSRTAQPTGNRPLTHEHIEKVVRHAREQGVQNFVRAFGRFQPIVRFTQGHNVKVVARELHIAMPELRTQLLPEVNLTANQNMFRELTTRLDEIVLRSLTESRMMQGHISVNLNIASMTTQTFERIAERVRERDKTSLWVELDVADVLANREAYRGVQRVLARNRVTSVADGADSTLVEAAEHADLGLDAYKFISPADIKQMKDLNVAAERVLNAEKLPILSRVESGGSVDAGQRLGIQVFQGYYIDDVMSAHSGTPAL